MLLNMISEIKQLFYAVSFGMSPGLSPNLKWTEPNIIIFGCLYFQIQVVVVKDVMPSSVLLI